MRIDELIEEAKKKQRDQSREAKLHFALEERRDKIFRRLAEAGEKWKIDTGIVRCRLAEVSSIRLSWAEAVASLAERSGDFESATFFWDIRSFPYIFKGRVQPEEETEKDQGGYIYSYTSKRDPNFRMPVVLWSGYVLSKRFYRLRHTGSDGKELDINVRQICVTGDYVGSCYERNRAISVGFSTGEGASAIRAAYCATLACYKKQSQTAELPHDLEQVLTMGSFLDNNP